MNPNVSFVGLLVVAAVAFVVPIALALTPARRLPAVVLLILAGIALGPSGIGLVQIDLPIQIMALLGLAFLLFLAGLEIEIHELRGRRLRLAVVAFVLSFMLAIVAGGAVAAAGLTGTPLLVAVIIVGTSLGIIIPILKDAGETQSPFGQLVIASASVADFGAIILLSVLFTSDGSGPASAVLLVGLLVALAVAFTVAVARAGRSHLLSDVLGRLQDTTAQIRVRGAFALLIGFAALAEALGLEVILGTFIAGAILRLIDTDRQMTHPQFRGKLEAIGYGVFVPVFFVATGLRFDLSALVASPGALAQVPIFVIALLVVRGLPTIVFRGDAAARQLAGGGLLQATLLPIAPTQIGLELGLLSPATGAALIVAGLVSVLIFPTLALAL
ncbi:MAG: cation:proton antiporter, partial [Candidatus Limnocylindrales bacterium]